MLEICARPGLEAAAEAEAEVAEAEAALGKEPALKAVSQLAM